MTVGSLHSELIRVEVGDVIFGNMTKTGDDTWYINGVDLETNEDTPLTVTKTILNTQPWVYVTLEVYDVEDCDQYPVSGTEMPYTDLILYEDGKETTLDWTIGTDGQQPAICNASITIVDSSDVTITF